jgi:pyruvate/2-oxoglutarate/acetoin dehydrogenase E1 component
MADAIEAVESALDEALDRRERIRIAGRKTALLGGIAAATAAGVGGVLVLATRRRSA